MKNITLIGGGLSGSLMAIFLAKRGYKINVYERRLDPRKANAYQGKSINLALSNRGIEALKKVGLDVPVLQTAVAMNGRMIHSLEGALAYQPYGMQGQAINSVSRGGLNIRLLELADEHENITLHFGQRCVDLNQDCSIATFEDENSNKTEVASDIFIGSDGAFAATRLHLQLFQRFDYDQEFENYGYKELHIPPTDSNEFALDKNCLHIWPRGNFMMIALPNIDKSYTCTLFFPFEGETSFATINNEQNARLFFEKYFADVVPLMPNYLNDYLLNPVGNLVTVKCFPWVFKDKLALIGDAAHAVVPFYGQGMNCSFEDCIVLDDCIAKYGDDWNKIFDEYQTLRKPNADAIAYLAQQNFIEMRDRVGDAKFLHRKHIEHELSEHFGHLFKSQYELVTFSLKPYAYALAQGKINDKILDALIEQNVEVVPGSEKVSEILKRFELTEE
ncbi:MAG: NAD(P)/FAD-dependent oxidoreductase [Bacteroidetes bacterium]|nr:NAD(P)/FAD-dependent oxidoreductase [Bacteroidota bacterium]